MLTGTCAPRPSSGYQGSGIPCSNGQACFQGFFPGFFSGSVFLGAHDATVLHTLGLSNGQRASLEEGRGM